MCLVNGMVIMWFAMYVHISTILVRYIITSYNFRYEGTKNIPCKNICLIWEIFILWLIQSFCHQMQQNNQIFGVFLNNNNLILLCLFVLVSEAKINALMEGCYPQLFNYCKERGCNSSWWIWGRSFQVVSTCFTTSGSFEEVSRGETSKICCKVFQLFVFNFGILLTLYF